VAERAHMSIGEVLNLLQEEFPDVTISKIRFLESQGLLDPERTASGYRKFYEPDVERLRWILRQQRENFLPLKVIKDRLAEHQRSGAPLDADETIVAGGGATDAGPGGNGETPTATPAAAAEGGDEGGAVNGGGELAAVSAGRRRGRASTRPVLDSGPTTVTLSREELAAASGLDHRTIGDLERYGLINCRMVGSDALYDEDAVVVAKLAAGFLRYGAEARHLRMYKVAAEREAGFFEQVVMPLLKQRNPGARQRAVESLDELASLGEGLRAAMLRQSLRGYAPDR
jgi:DNA-binding transcriptional MerR regulator